MRKTFLFLITLFFISNSLVFGANHMQEDWSFTILPDTIPPYVTDKFPPDGAVGIPIDSKISCYVRDDGVGVDINTIKLKVNNVEVFPTITGLPSAYFVEYQPGILPWNTIVNASVSADDLAN